MFENVTAGHGTCEGSEERTDCVKIAPKEDCWYGTGQQEKIKEERERKKMLLNAIPFRAGHFFTWLYLINFVTRRKMFKGQGLRNISRFIMTDRQGRIFAHVSSHSVFANVIVFFVKQSNAFAFL
jgi:hypothetical protein